MLEKYEVEGFKNFVDLIEEKAKSGKPIFTVFSGSTDKTTGVSWCSDCVVADPIINSVLSKIKDLDAIYIHVSVGDRNYWRDPNNEFRVDPRTKLTSVPTLLKYGSSKRLVENQCAKLDLVEMLFEN